ncbi:MAG: hypothetical protein JW882_13630 [Deltaproteobacteria bacterium]|nr:hypothetical protein [Deltaproteobacteria bacterium]
MARFLLCVVCFIFLAFGCGKSAEEKAIEKQIEEQTGAKADVDLSEDKIKVEGETEGGKFTVTSGEGSEIPDGFPADVFIYRPSKTIMAVEIPEGYSVSLTTKDDSSKVHSAYSQEMAERGWSEETSMKMGSQFVLVYEKEERAANISIMPLENEIQISMMVTMK